MLNCHLVGIDGCLKLLEVLAPFVRCGGLGSLHVACHFSAGFALRDPLLEKLQLLKYTFVLPFGGTRRRTLSPESALHDTGYSLPLYLLFQVLFHYTISQSLLTHLEHVLPRLFFEVFIVTFQSLAITQLLRSCMRVSRYGLTSSLALSHGLEACSGSPS